MCSMGYGVSCERGDYVSRGFRSHFPRGAVEMALARVIEN